MFTLFCIYFTFSQEKIFEKFSEVARDHVRVYLVNQLYAHLGAFHMSVIIFLHNYMELRLALIFSNTQFGKAK